tara:strand:- start:157 stop:390 length:234 start_codon:yes stop_codon:yes gene_type:complete
MRKLKNGGEVPELDKPVNLTILTKCPEKWQITDLETGRSYKATGNLELYKQWQPVYDENFRDTKNDPFKGTSIEGKD